MPPPLPKFTKTEDRILDVLQDGFAHPPGQLLAAIDEQADMGNLELHLCNIRKKLRPWGHDIIPKYVHTKAHYIHVILICSPDD